MHLTNNVDRAGVISPEQGRLSGLTSSHVQRTDEYGGGFFVNVEGLHHLHCLVSKSLLSVNAARTLTLQLQNLVRKSLYYNYDHYKALGMHAFKNEERILRLHVCRDHLFFPINDNLKLRTYRSTLS